MAYHQRSDWGARPRNGAPSYISPRGVAVHYVDEVVANVGHDQCAGMVRGIQNMHMDSRGWADIAYSMLVCRHGDIYEGRGVNVRTAANGTDAGNSGYVAVCALLGNEPVPEPTKAGIVEAAGRLGVADKEWTIHGRLYSTSCPGPQLAAWVDSGHPSSGGGGAPDDDQFTSADLDLLHEFAGRVGA